MVSNDTCWRLIIAGLILTVISAVVLYGGFYALPVWATTIAAIALTIGVICLVLGIVLLIANYIKAKTG